MSAHITTTDLQKQSNLQESQGLSLLESFGSPESKDKKEFQETQGTVVRKKRKTVYHSPFYHLIEEEEELTKKTPLPIHFLPMAKVEKIETSWREAFIIKIDSLPANHLFEEYQYLERHFSIDKTYKISESTQHGRTPIHYTETYLSEQTGDRIVVHGYLNKSGHYIYSQAKKNPKHADAEFGTTSKLEEIIKIGKDLEESIINNVHASSFILDALLEKRRKRYLEAKKIVEQLELKLAQQFERLKITSNIKDKLSQYIQTAKKLITAIKQLNQYGELEYPGNLVVSSMVLKVETWSQNFLEASKFKSISLKSSTLAETETDEMPFVATETTQDPVEAFYHSTFTKLQELFKSLVDIGSAGKIYATDKFDIIQIQSAQNLVEEINQQLILVFGLPNEFLINHYKKDQDTLLPQIYKKTTDHSTRCFSLFKAESLKGNLNTVQQLFPLVAKRVKDDFYRELINHVIVSSESGRKKLISVCDFFHEHSEDYASLVLSASENGVYSYPNKRFKALFPVMAEEISENLNLSTLFKLYCDGNLEVFEMLLRHGANPNVWSFELAGTNKRIFSTLYCITAFCKQDSLLFLKALLTYHADSNLMYSKETLSSGNREKMKHLKVFSKSTPGLKLKKIGGKKITAVNFELFRDGSPDSVLTLIAKMSTSIKEKFEGLNLFLPYSSVETIACSFSAVLEYPGVRVAHFMSTAPLIIFAKDRTSRSDRIEPYAAPESYRPFLSCVLYPDRSEEKLTECFKTLQMLHEALVAKLKTYDERQFEIAYNSLFKTGREELFKCKAVLALRAFYGCEFLLTEWCKLLTPIKQSILLKKLGPALSEQLVGTFSKITSLEPSIKQARIKLYVERTRICKQICSQKIQVNIENLGFQSCLSNSTSSSASHSTSLTTSTVTSTLTAKKSIPQPPPPPVALKLQEREPVSLSDEFFSATLLPSKNLLSWAYEINTQMLWEKWKKEFNEQRPNAEKSGYGPGALVVHRQSS